MRNSVFPWDERTIMVSTAVLKGPKTMKSSSSNEKEVLADFLSVN